MPASSASKEAREKYDMVAAEHTLNLMRVYWPADTSEPVLEQTIGTVLRVAAKTQSSSKVALMLIEGAGPSSNCLPRRKKSGARFADALFLR